jgi:hypothetical protein
MYKKRAYTGRTKKKSIKPKESTTPIDTQTQISQEEGNESHSSDSEHSLDQSSKQFSDELAKIEKQQQQQEEKTGEKEQEESNIDTVNSSISDPISSRGSLHPTKRKRSNSADTTFTTTTDGLLLPKITPKKTSFQSSTDIIKKKDVKELTVSELEGFWLTIEFCLEKDFLYCISLLTVSRAKEMLSYLSQVCLRKIPFVICSSGWAHAKSLDFISMNLEAIQSRGSQASICVRLCTPSQSRLAIISFPECLVVIKDYIQTLTGKYTTKPTFEDIKKEEVRISKVDEKR